MKIWQRIFLATLLIVNIFSIVMGLLLLDNQYNDQIKSAVDETKNLHENIYAGLDSEIQRKMQDIGKVFLDDKDYLECYRQIFDTYSDMGYGLRITSDNNDELMNYRFDVEDKNMKSEDNNADYYIINRTSYYFLIMISENQVYGRTIKCITEKDITNIYVEYEEQIKRLQLLSVGLALASAVILLVCIKFFLNPLKKLQMGIRDIAGGNYGKQLKKKGNTEIADLIVDINQMSKQIETDSNAKERLIEDRQAFIDNMAHEMKTPLTAILGFADILTIKQNLTEDQVKEYSEYIYKEAMRLKGMSGKLMELVQLQENNLNKELIYLTKLLEEVVQTEEIIFQKENISIQEDLQKVWIYGDEDMLKSLFYNILDNAKKATKFGGVINVSLCKQGENAIVRIRDYGIGIPKDEIEKITEPFYMVDKSRTRKNGGAGLGLTLCKKIVEISDGTMILESEEGKGCNVIITWKAENEKK